MAFISWQTLLEATSASMAAFTQEEIDADWPTWNLFQNGGVVLFRRHDLLQASVEHLIAANYKVVVVDCHQHASVFILCGAVVTSLGVADCELVNLDSFNDFIYQIEFEGQKGVVIALTNFMDAWKLEPRRALDVADILADNHRGHLLMGNRLLTLLQCDDPNMDQVMGRIGGCLPIWNSAEWLRANRE
jgi:hypothetical protein